jgi:hypothetical protein
LVAAIGKLVRRWPGRGGAKGPSAADAARERDEAPAPIGQEAQPATAGSSREEVEAVNDEGAGLRFRAFVGKTSTDFSLSALRFIVAVSFFGINVRVLDSLMNAPSNSP